jgi:hypothetical protein
MFEPSRKVTVPAGVPDPGAFAVTVAIKVTVWPKTEEEGAALTAVVVLSWPTVSVVVPELLVKLVSPL